MGTGSCNLSLIMSVVLKHILRVCTDLTITTEKLKDLFASVHHEENVDRIGRNLHLPQSKIDLVKRNYRNPLERKEAYLDLYVHDHPCPSWKEIARILYAFRLSQQADMVYTIYIKGI